LFMVCPLDCSGGARLEHTGWTQAYAGAAGAQPYVYAASSFNAYTKVSRSAVDVYTCGVTRTP
jgi:hypothetical protein